MVALIPLAILVAVILVAVLIVLAITVPLSIAFHTLNSGGEL